jgi:hypothetical protein
MKGLHVTSPDLSEFFVIKQCAVSSLSFSKEQREKFNAALKYPTSIISNVTILQVLENWGFKAKKTSLSEHRRGKCCCKND